MSRQIEGEIMQNGLRYLLASGVLLVVMATSTAASAQEGGGVINLEETVIEGRIQKPEAFYILQHANLSYEALDPDKSFIPELLETVEKEPF